LIDQFATRARAVQDLARVYHDAVYEFNGIAEHFSEHVRSCIEHLGSEGFEARFKTSNTAPSVVDFINDLLAQYNHRAAGNSVGEDGHLGGPTIVDLETPPAKSFFELDRESFVSSIASSSGEKVKEADEGAASSKAEVAGA